VVHKARLSDHVVELRQSYHGTTMTEPWYRGRFCRETPLPVTLDKSPKVDEWRSKSGSRINNHLLTYLLALLWQAVYMYAAERCRVCCASVRVIDELFSRPSNDSTRPTAMSA